MFHFDQLTFTLVSWNAADSVFLYFNWLPTGTQTYVLICFFNDNQSFSQDAFHQPVSHHRPLKAVPIAVAEEEGSESEEDDLKPRGNLWPPPWSSWQPFNNSKEYSAFGKYSDPFTFSSSGASCFHWLCLRCFYNLIVFTTTCGKFNWLDMIWKGTNLSI